MTSDISNTTQQKLLETKLKDSEARYRLLAENCMDMIACLDLDGRYTYVSPASLPLFDQAENDLLGHAAIEFTHPDDRALLVPILDEIKAKRGVRTVTFRRRRKDGQYCWVESKLQGIRDVDGTISGIILTARDISERRQVEEELRIAATAFETQEGMVISAADGIILRVNRAFTEITGYSAAEVVGRTSRVLKSGRHDQAFYQDMWDRIARTGTWRGEIWNRRKNGEIYPEWLNITAVKGAGGEITHYVGAFTDITQRKATEQEIERLAFYDPLTRLPNRRLLQDRLQHALESHHRSNCVGALLFIDLDNFKIINDSLGHDKGDLLLQQTARRLMSCVRKSDTVARLGGDEFVVMLEGLNCNWTDAAAQAKRVAEKILRNLAVPYTLGGYECDCPSSIGVTFFGDDREAMDEILKRADHAMYRAKTAGRNAIRFFGPEMQSAITERISLETELRTAVRDRQFVLHYQPQLDSLGRVTGVEALLRWQHPEHGMVFPDKFIPVAEETGLILPLGQWVLETACARLAEWSKRPSTAHLTMAVNVSACQFHQPHFVDQVLACLERSGVDPTKLTLELTESTFLDDIPDTLAKMTAMKARGLSFSLDDFGTGCSSLIHLKRLPVSQLKIDRSFVADVGSDANAAGIVKSIVFLARSLGLSVIAEGVETEEQRDFLANNGCLDYQGYLFSRPLPLETFEAFMAGGGMAGNGA